MEATAVRDDASIAEPPPVASWEPAASELKGFAPTMFDARRESEPPAPRPPKSSRRRKEAVRTLRLVLRRLATVGIAGLAVLIALMTWDVYSAAPWTRDGRVRVQVASVAPQISGQIKQLHVVDNQFVRKGDILYVIDPFDFEVAVRANKAALQQRMADLRVKQLQSQRRNQLTDLAISTEQKQVFEGNAMQADAAVDAARQQVAQAEINLQRTEVRSPVNGIVTNLLLREGDYARQGAINVSIIDTDSYWIDGYFEETKLARLCVGDRAEAKLIGFPTPIIGHVATVTRGISVSNAAGGAQGLPNVDPVYTWVRLAQRVPVRIAIDKVPPGLPLVSGLTATVTIRPGRDDESTTRLQKVRAGLQSSFLGVTGGAPARSGCIPDPL
jgi:multidrug resistance efflux pump